MPSCIFTGRNEVVAKVMFLQVSVILSTGGGGPENPPQTRQTPPDQGEPPRDQGELHPSRDQGEPHPSRDQGEPPLDQGEPPQTKENPPGTKENPPGPRRPPWTRQIPPGKKTAAYGQWAAGTHPTGMQSCCFCTWSGDCLRLLTRPRWYQYHGTNAKKQFPSLRKVLLR